MCDFSVCLYRCGGWEENKENFSLNLSFAGVRAPCLLHRVPDDIGKALNGLAIPSVIHLKAPT